MTEFNHERRRFLKKTGRIITQSLLWSGVSAFGALQPRLSRAAGKKIRIGFLPITDATPLLIAHGMGYYKDEGLNVERPIRVRSWSTLSESLLTGKFDLSHMLLPIPVWMRYNKKFPVKILAWDHTNGSAITVRSDSGIEGFADLGGKQIAVPFWYSMHNVILQMGLRKYGLKPVIQSQSKPLKTDETNLFILPPPDMPAALAGRKIDGFVVAEPFNAISEIRINAKILRFTGDMWQNHPCCVVVMREADIQSDPVTTQKLVNAVVRAQLFCIKNPEKAARMLSREGENYLPVPYDVLLRVFTHYQTDTYGTPNIPTAIRHPQWPVARLGFQPYPYPSATRFITNELRQTVMEGDSGFLENLNPDFVVGDLVDDHFVKKAILEAGGLSEFSLIDITRPWEREEVIDI